MVSSTSSASTLHESEKVDGAVAICSDEFKPDARFWLVFLSLAFSMFLSALDVSFPFELLTLMLTSKGHQLTAVSTILPTIAQDLEATDVSWIGSSYSLSSTAVIPFVGGMASVFGRRPVVVTALITFIAGSAVSASAQSYAPMLVGRTIQGIGGGAILVCVEIIVSDLTPIASRGAYYGILGLVWAFSSVAAPPLAGALASANQWRWVFYLNLPVGGLALGLIWAFLNVKAPKRTFREQLRLIDYNNFLFIAAATSATLGLSWGGSPRHAWSSASVLAPIILGVAGMALYVYLESFVVNPTIPWAILSNRTSAIGYVTNVAHSIVVLALIYFLPTFFQSVHGDSAVRSGIDIFSVCFTIAPMAIVGGIAVTVTGKYKYFPNIAGWVLMSIGLGLMTLPSANTSKQVVQGYSAIVGLGAGCLYSGTTFPVIAPLQPSQNAQAMVAHAFTRSFGQVLGIAIGGGILTSGLSKRLPTDFVGGNGNVAFSAIPAIKSLPDVLRQEVRVAFTESLRTIWLFLAILSAVMTLVALFMRSLPLTTEMDDTFGLEDKKSKTDTMSV